MTVDLQMAWNVVMAILGTVVVPYLGALNTRIKDAADKASSSERELLLYKTHVAENYISVERFNGFEEALFRKLDTIEGKVDGKMDKT